MKKRRSASRAPIKAERPGVLPTHQRRSRESRDSLLKAGERVFAMHGFGDAHVSKIVRLAGCSIGSFYRRFKDKQALFLALQSDMYDAAHADIEKFFADAAEQKISLTWVFFRFVENSASQSRKLKGYYRALFEIGLRGAMVWRRMRALERHQAEHLRALLLARNRKNLRSDFVPAMALAIRMMSGGQVDMMLYGPGPFRQNDHARQCEFTRMLMGVARIAADERELRRLRLPTRRAR